VAEKVSLLREMEELMKTIDLESWTDDCCDAMGYASESGEPPTLTTPEISD